jgi:hypothetical protein
MAIDRKDEQRVRENLIDLNHILLKQVNSSCAMFVSKNVEKILKNSIKVLSSSKFNISEIPNFASEIHLKGPKKSKFNFSRADLDDEDMM